MALSNAIREILNNLSPRLRSQDFLLGDYLSAKEEELQSGNLGIKAEAGDVDAVALGGGNFARDTDVADGKSLTFAWKAASWWNGKTLVAVPAGTIVLAPSTYNYLQMDQTGTITANTTGFASDGSQRPLWRIQTGSGSYTDANVVSMRPIVQWVPKGLLTGSLLSPAAKAKYLCVPLGTIAATKFLPIVAPAYAATIVSAHLLVDTTLAANDANYWFFALQKRGAAGTGSTDLLDSGAVNSTKVTGGSGLTANVARSLGLHATAANKDTLAAEGLTLACTKTGTPADLSNASLLLGFAVEG
ncbi:MAG: hypothetical protein ACM359_16530 [Bacillota bacterium]